MSWDNLDLADALVVFTFMQRYWYPCSLHMQMCNDKK